MRAYLAEMSQQYRRSSSAEFLEGRHCSACLRRIEGCLGRQWSQQRIICMWICRRLRYCCYRIIEARMPGYMLIWRCKRLVDVEDLQRAC